jgi:hypothetical protein
VVLRGYAKEGSWMIKKVTIEKTDEPDRIDYDVSDAFDKADYLEDMRTYQKPKTKLDQNKIKLYVMILK